MAEQHVQVAIIGSGFGGLGAAIRLLQAGVTDLVVLEKAGEVGGTWRDNTYPGCACDVQSHLYSFSFLPNPDWSHVYSPQPEILAYLKRCADQAGVTPRIRFHHQVEGLRWDDAEKRWHLQTSRGPFTARFVISATGPLSEPLVPDLPGLESFQGPRFHSAQWDWNTPLEGRRVAVIGTGASAAQFIPAIQPKVKSLAVFQRTPPWVLPRDERKIRPLTRWLYRHLPMARALTRQGIYWSRELLVPLFRRPAAFVIGEWMARRYLKQQIADGTLRARLTPRYTMGCKRVILSNTYLPALASPNVQVIASGVREVRGNTLIGQSGEAVEADVLIFGTGFHVSDTPLARVVTGRGGVTLQQKWGVSPSALLGTMVSGFPNLFLMLGPNTGLGHTSVVFMMEAQLELVLRAIQQVLGAAKGTIEPTEEAQITYNRGLDEALKGTVWTAGGCSSWYLDATGRCSTLWPGFSWQFYRRAQQFNPAEYKIEAAPGTAVV